MYLHNANFNYYAHQVVLGVCQRYTYRVLQTIQMKLIILCVWAEPAVLGAVELL